MQARKRCYHWKGHRVQSSSQVPCLVALTKQLVLLERFDTWCPLQCCVGDPCTTACRATHSCKGSKNIRDHHSCRCAETMGNNHKSQEGMQGKTCGGGTHDNGNVLLLVAAPLSSPFNGNSSTASKWVITHVGYSLQPARPRTAPRVTCQSSAHIGWPQHICRSCCSLARTPPQEGQAQPPSAS